MRRLSYVVPVVVFALLGGVSTPAQSSPAHGYTAKGGAAGGGGQIVIGGEVTSIDVPFELGGVFPGATVVFSYTPEDETGGAVTYSFSGSGVTGSGEGRFTMTPQADGTVLIEQTVTGCVHGVGSCRTTMDVVILTPKTE